jgi:hypothetical protein
MLRGNALDIDIRRRFPDMSEMEELRDFDEVELIDEDRTFLRVLFEPNAELMTVGAEAIDHVSGGERAAKAGFLELLLEIGVLRFLLEERRLQALDSWTVTAIETGTFIFES